MTGDIGDIYARMVFIYAEKVKKISSERFTGLYKNEKLSLSTGLPGQEAALQFLRYFQVVFQLRFCSMISAAAALPVFIAQNLTTAKFRAFRLMGELSD